MVRNVKTNGTAKVSTSGRTAGKKSSALSWTSIVRNTRSMGTTPTTPSYTPVIMPGRRRGACEKEKIGLQRISAVSPVVATKVSDEEYKISLSFEALKEVMENFDELDLCGVNVKLCTVSWDTVFSGEVSFTNKMTANEAEIGTLNVTDKATIQELEVIGTSTFDDEVLFKDTVTFEDTINTNGINNTGTITSDTVTATDVNATNVNADDVQTKTITVSEKATIAEEDVAVSNIQQANIENANIDRIETITIGTATIEKAIIEDAEIEKEKVKDSEIDNLVVNEKATVKGDLQVDGKTDVQELEVNGKADFREDVKVYDDFYVSGDTVLNGDTKINGTLTVNGDETHNGDAVFNGDVQITWTLTADSLDIDISEYQKKDEKGVASGYASLDNTGKVPMSQLPNISGGVVYKGGWDASTGSYPSNPSNGDMYYCTTAGTVSGQTYNVGDRIIYDADNNRWDVLPDNYGVQSVNGRTGIVTGVQDTVDRKDTVDLVAPATTKYLSEKAVADLINPLIQRIEDLEEEAAKTTVVSLDSTSGLPATMNEGQTYTVPFQNLTTTDHIVILDTVTNGNVVITPGNGQISIVSSANESNPVVNVLVIKSA